MLWTLITTTVTIVVLRMSVQPDPKQCKKKLSTFTRLNGDTMKIAVQATRPGKSSLKESVFGCCITPWSLSLSKWYMQYYCVLHNCILQTQKAVDLLITLYDDASTQMLFILPIFF